MILLDTNILSEFSRRSPAPSVIAWLDTLPEGSVALPFGAVAEIQKGISDLMLKNLQKAIALQQWLDDLLASDVQFLPMEVETARILGRMYAVPTLRDLWTVPSFASKPKMKQDLAIAATAIAYQIPVATRNTNDFERINELFPLPGIVNPFDFGWPALFSEEQASSSKSNFIQPSQLRTKITLN